MKSEILEGLRDLVERELNTLADAKKISATIVEQIRKHYGGEIIYIPMGKLFANESRNDEIFRKFTGTNHKQLAHQYNLSETHIYRIIENEKHKRQVDLFS